jgi:hypothetical protein
LNDAAKVKCIAAPDSQAEEGIGNFAEINTKIPTRWLARC